MPKTAKRLWRFAAIASIAVLLSAASTDLAAAGDITVKSNITSREAKPAEHRGHTPWRYKHMRHRHARPLEKGQKPVIPCVRDAGANKKERAQ